MQKSLSSTQMCSCQWQEILRANAWLEGHFYQSSDNQGLEMQKSWTFQTMRTQKVLDLPKNKMYITSLGYLNT